MSEKDNLRQIEDLVKGLDEKTRKFIREELQAFKALKDDPLVPADIKSIISKYFKSLAVNPKQLEAPLFLIADLICLKEQVKLLIEHYKTELPQSRKRV